MATIISYLTGPVCVAALRRVASDLDRPLRTRLLALISPCAFVLASLVLYWARWPLTGQILLLMIAALPIYIYYQHKSGWQQFGREWQGALWMVCYLPTMALLSWVGSKQFGGIGLLPYGWDMLAVSLVSLGFFYWGVASGWRTPYLEERHAQSKAFKPDEPAEDALAHRPG